MNSSTSGTNSNMNDSLNYRHAGRTYKLTPWNLLKDVSIAPPIHSDHWQHLVFSLDKVYLRNSAIGFDQFRDTAASQTMLKSLAFFLVLCERICTEGTTTNNLDCVLLLEWVKSATTNKYVGIRLHFFTNRKGKTNAQSILIRMLAENTDFAAKNNRQFVKNTMAWDSWRSITNYHEWAAQICDPYSKHHRATSALDDNKFFMTTHAAHPLNVFSLDSNTFTIKGAGALQNNRSNYKRY